jgi:hypothetical protein
VKRRDPILWFRSKVPRRWMTLNSGAPLVPRFVVMTTTPFVALDP